MKQDLRTSLKRVRGLGSAHDGTHHFIWQRLTAIALIPLTLWFIFSLIRLAANGDRPAIVEWMSSGMHAGMLILMLIALFYHAAIGMQVIIEDYVHCKCAKVSALLINALLMIALGFFSVLAVLKLHFAGA